MAFPDYEPVTDLEASRKKLREIVDNNAEVEDNLLFEGIVDVLASRGGERWKKLDELWLSTRTGIRIAVAYVDSSEDIEPHFGTERLAEITTVSSGIDGNYGVRRWLEADFDISELYKIDPESDERLSVDNILGPSLAAARLLSLLADAHEYSPLEELTDDCFED